MKALREFDGRPDTALSAHAADEPVVIGSDDAGCAKPWRLSKLKKVGKWKARHPGLTGAIIDVSMSGG